MKSVSQKSLEAMADQAGVMIEANGGWVRPAGESRWYRRRVLYDQLRHQLRKAGLNE